MSENIVDKLQPNEVLSLINTIKDALKRGYALGFSDGISMSKGRPQSSDSDSAIKHYIEQFKEQLGIKNL